MTAVELWLAKTPLVRCDVRGTKMTEHACAARWTKSSHNESRGRKALMDVFGIQGLECIGCPSGGRRANQYGFVTEEEADQLLLLKPTIRVRALPPDDKFPTRTSLQPLSKITCKACQREEERRNSRSRRFPDFDGYCRMCMRWATRCLQSRQQPRTVENRQAMLDLVPELAKRVCKRCTVAPLVWTTLDDPLFGYCKICLTHARVRVGKGARREDLAVWLESN